MTRARLAAACLVTAFLDATHPARAETIGFGRAPIGSLPGDFEVGRTGKGAPAEWKVVADASAQGGRALAQVTTDATSYRFPLAIYKPLTARDVEVTTRCKPVSGKIDQACGIGVRLSSPDDYYIARANALENNVRLYRIIKGNRQQIASADVKVAANEWHRLTLRAEGDRFAVSFDGRQLFTATDRTFPDAGRGLLWTKADSVTHFDRIEIRSLH